MPFTKNKVVLIGNLTADAEHRYTTKDKEVTTFTLATQNSYKLKDGGWINNSVYHNIVAFKLSDFYKKELKKGRRFNVEGRLDYRSYENKDGQKVYVTEIICDNYCLIPLYDKNEASPTANVGDENLFSSSPEDDDLPF